MSSPLVVIESVSALEKMVGQEIAVSDWLEITQQRIDAFAAATEDHQWIHVDVERAKASPLGSTIAHGYLTLSLIAGFSFRTFRIDGVKMGLNYGLNKVRFTSMVPAGSRLRAHFVLKSAERIEGGLQTTYTVTIEREGSDRPACVAETVSRVLTA